STIAQMGPPRMLVPIALGLSWPDRLEDVDEPSDWTRPSTWEFHPLDHEAFPAVRLAEQVGRAGGTFPAVYNAATEECVAAFHDRLIGFPDIVDVVAQVVDDHAGAGGNRFRGSSVDMTVDQVLAADAWARTAAATRIGAARQRPE